MTDTLTKDLRPVPSETDTTLLGRFSQGMVAIAERWFPDAYVFVDRKSVV